MLVPRAHFATSVRTLVAVDSRGPTPTLSFAAPPAHRRDFHQPEHNYLADQVGASISVPIQDPTTSSSATPVAQPIAPRINHDRNVSDDTLRAGDTHTAHPSTDGTLVGLDVTAAGVATAFVASGSSVTARNVSCVPSGLSLKPSAETRDVSAGPTSPLLPVTISTTGEGHGELTVSFDTVSLHEPAFDLHFHVTCSHPLNAKPAPAQVRCTAQLANPVAIPLHGVQVVLRDSHVRDWVGTALKYDERQFSDEDDSTSSDEGGNDDDASFLVRSAVSRSDSDSDGEGGVRATGEDGNIDDDAFSLPSISDTAHEAFNHLPVFAQTLQGPIDLRVGEAVAVPMFDTATEVRVVHRCGSREDALRPFVAIRHIGEGVLECGTVNCAIPGMRVTFLPRKTLTITGDESYFRTELPRTVMLRKRVCGSADVRRLGRDVGGRLVVRRKCVRVTTFEMRNRREEEAEAVLSVKCGRDWGEPVETTTRVVDGVMNSGVDTEMGIEQEEGEVTGMRELMPYVGKRCFAVVVKGLAARTLVVWQTFTHEERLGLPGGANARALGQVLGDGGVDGEVADMLREIAEALSELGKLRRKRIMYSKKESSLKFYVRNKAMLNVSSDDEDYDDEAGADGMTGMVQRYVRINETVEKGVLWVLEKRDEVDVLIAEKKDEIRDLTEKLVEAV